MKKFRAALIGCGRIGFILEGDPLRNKPCTHFGGISRTSIKITGACDINRERLHHFADTAGLPADAAYTCHKKMLKEKKFDLITIATWTENHSEIALDAIDSGAKIIVLEKPVSHSLKSARAIIEAADKKNCRIIINHERRYDYRYRKVGHIIDSGKIGEVKTVNARILTGPLRGESRINSGGGPLLHDGTHLVDIIRFYFGEVISVKGEFSRDSRDSGFEDTALAWIKTESGVNIFLESGGGRKYFLFELEIWGTEGKILIGNGYEKLFIRNKSKLYKGFNDLEETKFPAMTKNSCFEEIYKEAELILKGKTDNIASDGADGYRALEIIHGIYLSAHRKREITLPLQKSGINLKKIFNL